VRSETRRNSNPKRARRAPQKSEERDGDGKAKAGRKRGCTITDVHQLSEAAARRLGEAQPRPALNGQELAFEGGSFRARARPHPNPHTCASAGPLCWPCCGSSQ